MDIDPRLHHETSPTAAHTPSDESGTSPVAQRHEQSLSQHEQPPSNFTRDSPLQRDPATPSTFAFTSPPLPLFPATSNQRPHHSSVPASPAPFTPGSRSSFSQDQKRPRACESCRGLKVKCEPNDPAVPAGTCRRCARANRQCIFTQPTRKRQKKSDSKVAELEKKIDALTASLEATREAAKAAQSQGADEDDDDDMGSDSERHARTPTSHGHQNKRRRSDSDGEANAAGRSFHPIPDTMKGFLPQGTRLTMNSTSSVMDDRIFPMIETVDVIDQELLSLDMARKLFDHYKKNMAPHFPAVIFPPEYTVEELRKTKPTLFLAILASASGTAHPDLHRALQKETARTFAERIFVGSDKSLEIVQALLVMSLWYYPPDHFEELKFYTLIHMAAIMAMDLGLGKRSKRPPPPQAPGMPPNSVHPMGKPTSITASFNALSTKEKGLPLDVARSWGTTGGPSAQPRLPYSARMHHFPDPCTIEARRTLLACYWSCSHVAVSLRRPNMLRLTNFMKESIEILETSPEAAESDKVLCEWVRMQIISEEIAQTFELDDPSAEVSVHDTRVQLATRSFVRRLDEWKEKVAPTITIKSIMLHYYITALYAHEVALHIDHNTDDFRPPFTERIIREPLLKPYTTLAPYQLDSISASINSAQAMLDVFCSLSIEDLLSVPIFVFVRCAYGCMILIRVWITAATPGCELGKVLKKEDLRVDEYLNRSLTHLANAAKGDRTRPAGKFTMIIVMLRSWYMKRRMELEGHPPTAASPRNGDTPMVNTDSPMPTTSPGLTNATNITNVTAEVPTTPEAHEVCPSRQLQTPLQLLSTAAAGLQSACCEKFPTHHQEEMHTPQLVEHQQQQFEYHAPGQVSASSNYPAPPAWFDAMNISGWPEGPAGDTGLGLGGGGRDPFTEDHLWGMMEPEITMWPSGGTDLWGGYGQ